MANYLPVLLVSVTAGMPDDAALQPLPRGQVDYLSHKWVEEDVWRSWRNMTKQKNEIANGMRLENASWRTWMKQRNNLKTVSPETLNWYAFLVSFLSLRISTVTHAIRLKDSDVTWLYGPLHTALDWETTKPKPQLQPSSPRLQERRTPGEKANSLSSPSSSVALDRMREQQPGPPLRSSSHEGPSQSVSSTMKPILKHRSIAEMLTGALPPAPSWFEPGAGSMDDSDDDDDGEGSAREPHEKGQRGKGRPPLYHTLSDTNVIPRFGRSGSQKDQKGSPPRIADATSSRESDAAPHVHALNEHQRSGASNNLLEMAHYATNNVGSYSQADSGYSSPYKRSSMTELPLNDASSWDPGVRFEEAGGAANDDVDHAIPPSIMQQPQKKHISFNAIVEQCISIEGGSVPVTPSQAGQLWGAYDEEYVPRRADSVCALH